MNTKTTETRPNSTKTNNSTTTNPTNLRIQMLNDRLRKTGDGGKVLLTDGVMALGPDFAKTAIDTVADFSLFTKDNDPWDEHDCGTVWVAGEIIIWKIDYYDRKMEFHSPDIADSRKTIRVLTIMLAAEY
jgi:Protein of unknown function (DUF3768)